MRDLPPVKFTSQAGTRIWRGKYKPQNTSAANICEVQDCITSSYDEISRLGLGVTNHALNGIWIDLDWSLLLSACPDILTLNKDAIVSAIWYGMKQLTPTADNRYLMQTTQGPETLEDAFGSIEINHIGFRPKYQTILKKIDKQIKYCDLPDTKDCLNPSLFVKYCTRKDLKNLLNAFDKELQTLSTDKNISKIRDFIIQCSWLGLLENLIPVRIIEVSHSQVTTLNGARTLYNKELKTFSNSSTYRVSDWYLASRLRYHWYTNMLAHNLPYFIQSYMAGDIGAETRNLYVNDKKGPYKVSRWMNMPAVRIEFLTGKRITIPKILTPTLGVPWKANVYNPVADDSVDYPHLKRLLKSNPSFMYPVPRPKKLITKKAHDQHIFAECPGLFDQEEESLLLSNA